MGRRLAGLVLVLVVAVVVAGGCTSEPDVIVVQQTAPASSTTAPAPATGTVPDRVVDDCRARVLAALDGRTDAATASRAADTCHRELRVVACIEGLVGGSDPAVGGQEAFNALVATCTR